MPEMDPKVYDAAANVMLRTQAELRKSLAAIVEDIAFRKQLKKAGEFAGSEYRYAVLIERQRVIEYELARLQRVFKSKSFVNYFTTQAEGVARGWIPASAVTEFDAIRKKAKGVNLAFSPEAIAAGEVPAELASAGRYALQQSLFVQKELLGTGQGLYNLVSQKISNQVSQKIAVALNNNQTYDQLTKELVDVYKFARGSKAQLFSVGADRGDVGNAMRAAYSEMHYAANNSAMGFAESNSDIIGIVIDFSGACDLCVEAYTNPRTGNGEWLLTDNPPVPGSVHPNDDCEIVDYIFRTGEKEANPRYDERIKTGVGKKAKAA